MNLQIRNPRAYELARRLAESQKTTLTEAVITALEAQLAEQASRPSLDERLSAIARHLRARSKGTGRDLTKDEIDAMWGHE